MNENNPVLQEQISSNNPNPLESSTQAYRRERTDHWDAVARQTDIRRGWGGLIAANRSYFGLGEFDLLFGAAKQNLKSVDLPVRYRERTYGTTNIQRWKQG
jgi:hypothetical protein